MKREKIKSEIIINTLKNMPNSTVSEVADFLDTDTLQVGMAQQKYIKNYIKRDSPLWGEDGISVVHSMYMNNRNYAKG